MSTSYLNLKRTRKVNSPKGLATSTGLYGASISIPSSSSNIPLLFVVLDPHDRFVVPVLCWRTSAFERRRESVQPNKASAKMTDMTGTPTAMPATVERRIASGVLPPAQLRVLRRK